MFFPGLVDLSFFLFVLFGCMRAELLYLLKPVVTQRDL